MNCIIIEDNKLQQHVISEFVKITEGLELIGVYSNVVEIMANSDSLLNIDVLFLDVELPIMTGIEFLEKFKPTVNVILITGNKNYALDAFNNDVIDYLVKPIEYSRFLRSINKLKQLSSKNESIYIKSNGAVIKLYLNEILWVKSANEYLIIYTSTKKYMIYSTILNFMNKLPDYFMRVHRSHIINSKKINSFIDNHVNIAHYKIKVSKTYLKDVQKIII